MWLEIIIKIRRVSRESAKADLVIKTATRWRRKDVPVINLHTIAVIYPHCIPY